MRVLLTYSFFLFRICPVVKLCPLRGSYNNETGEVLTGYDRNKPKRIIYHERNPRLFEGELEHHEKDDKEWYY